MWSSNLLAEVVYLWIPSLVFREPGFRMPDDKTLPMFAVSAGAGIAPFRSFWQHRKINKDMLLSECGSTFI